MSVKKYYGLSSNAKSDIDVLCRNSVNGNNGGLAIPFTVAKSMISMLDSKDFFNIEPYCSKSYFDKEAFTNSHRILDICCNSGILLEHCYHNFMRIFLSDEYSFCFESAQAAEDYVLKELLFAFVPDTELCGLIRKKFYHDKRCHGNIYNYNIITKLGIDMLYISIVDDCVVLGDEKMKFDVVVGNPPYNNDMYIDFVLEGHKLAKAYDIWITPAKFQTAADDYKDKSTHSYVEFRNEIIDKITDICFYPDALDIFNISQVDGIAYYLVGKGVVGNCNVVNKSVHNRTYNSSSIRPITNRETLYNAGFAIISKLGNYESFKPSKVDTTKAHKLTINTQFTMSGAGSEQRKTATCGKVSGIFNQDGTIVVIGNPTISNTMPDASHLCAFSSDDITEVENFKSWISSKFVRFFVMCNVSKLTGIYTDDYFRFVPDPGNFDKVFEDKPMLGYQPDVNGEYKTPDGKTHCSLYVKYKLTQQEINVIEAVIKEHD